jgi:hypothetical protein
MLADWDARLLTPERALHLAGDWPVYYTIECAVLSQFNPEAGGEPMDDQWQVNQRCGKCDQSITMLARACHPVDTVSGPHTTTADQLSDVIRHMVTAHNLSLSGASS